MTNESDNWAQIEKIFNEAIELPTLEQDSFIEQASSSNVELLAELKQLLMAHRSAGDFLEKFDTHNAAALLNESDLRHETQKIGPYKILGILGRGGMGIVYLAERDDGQFKQQVALKLIKRGMDSEEILSRFLNERQILAQLQHPNITQLLDGGINDTGQPYFTMEYIDGIPITTYCNNNHLDINARLKLFIKVCKAIQYAHVNLVIHRDLKPSNILVTTGGEPKLLDFGIAKLLDPDTDKPSTKTGHRLLTPEYSAPEQITGGNITTATDTYALGIILYELLTGDRPYNFDRSSLNEVSGERYQTTPLKPSSKLLQTIKTRTNQETDPESSAELISRRWYRSVKGDLDNIVMMALRKESIRRYSSTQALVDDIERYLTGHTVLARKDTVLYRFNKLIQRHKLSSVAILLAAVSLIVGLSIAMWQGELARNEADKAEANSTFLLELLSKADPANAQGNKLITVELLDSAAQQLNAENNPFKNQPKQKAQLLFSLGNLYKSLGKFNRADQYLSESLELYRKVVNETDPAILTAMESLLDLHRLQGKYKQAEAIAIKIFNIRSKVFGKQHTTTITTRISLANIYRENGEYDKAEILYHDALLNLEKRLGTQHKIILELKNDLSILYRRQGQYEKSEKFALQSVEGRRLSLGDKHPDTLYSMYNLALVYKKLAKYQRSLKLSKATLVLMHHVLGKEHPHTLVTTYNLASTYRRMGEYDKAEQLLDNIYDIQRKVLGITHRQTMLSYAEYAHLQKGRGILESAEGIYLEVFDNQKQQLGMNHRHTLITMRSLAGLYLKQKRYAEVEEILTKATPLHIISLGEKHPDTIKLQNTKIKFYLQNKLYTKAKNLATETLKSSQYALGNEHPITLAVKFQLGLAYKKDKQYEQALSYFQMVFESYQSRYGVKHKKTRKTIKQLISIYKKQNKPKKAKQYKKLLMEAT